MGVKFSPSLTKIYMAQWESKYVFHKLFFGSVVWYGCYIDDLLILLWCNVATITDLIRYFNNNCFSLRFTSTFDTYSILVWNLTLQGNSTTHKTEAVTFQKESTGNSILFGNSCHPIHTIKAISMGELYKYFTLVSMGINYNIKQYINLNTTFKVYLITCDQCRLQYVGSTTCSLKVRVGRNLLDVNNPFIRRFLCIVLKCMCVVFPLFSMQGIESVNQPLGGVDHLRKLCNREAYWIFLWQNYRPNRLIRDWTLLCIIECSAHMYLLFSFILNVCLK